VIPEEVASGLAREFQQLSMAARGVAVTFTLDAGYFDTCCGTTSLQMSWHNGIKQYAVKCHGCGKSMSGTTRDELLVDWNKEIREQQENKNVHA